MMSDNFVTTISEELRKQAWSIIYPVNEYFISPETEAQSWTMYIDHYKTIYETYITSKRRLVTYLQTITMILPIKVTKLTGFRVSV